MKKTLEQIFGIPDDGSEDEFESDEAEEFNVNGYLNQMIIQVTSYKILLQ